MDEPGLHGAGQGVEDGNIHTAGVQAAPGADFFGTIRRLVKNALDPAKVGPGRPIGGKTTTGSYARNDPGPAGSIDASSETGKSGGKTGLSK